MEDYQATGDIKEEVVDCGFFEVSQDVHQLCMACLCATRTNHKLSDGALKQYYMHILTEMQLEGGVVSQSPRVCWECVAQLKRSVRFREQVQDSYRLLQPMLSMCDKEDLNEFLQTSVRRPGQLKTCFAHSINISPQDDGMQVMTVTEHDDDNDDKAALGSLENDFERHSSTFTEDDTSIVEEPSEAFCDEKYDVYVSEDAVQSPPMCNYNIDNYQDHDRSKEQLDETVSDEEVLNGIKTINTLLTHEASRHIENNFVCDYCLKGFTSKPALERHIATYNIHPHNNKTVPSPCEDCAVVLCSDDQCSECPNKHRLHNMKTNLQNVLKVLHQCKVCQNSFTSKDNLLTHKRLNTGEKLFQCDVCYKSFARKGNLDTHKRIHTGEKHYQCDVCHKSFAHKSNFIRHKRTHTGEKPYQCDVCHKSFARKSNFIRHKRTHTGEKPYHCDVCYKSFAQTNDLIRHKRTHTVEKPYQCEVCYKSFAKKGNFNTHKRVHTGEKSYQCEVCYKSFAKKGDLNTHKRIHTGDKPFQCEVCHKSFTQTNHLNTHKRIHTGEKPFQCEVCHKSFAYKCVLINHKTTHTGEKPFQCEVCHKSFARKYDLIRHKRIHTGDKPY